MGICSFVVLGATATWADATIRLDPASLPLTATAAKARLAATVPTAGGSDPTAGTDPSTAPTAGADPGSTATPADGPTPPASTGPPTPAPTDPCADVPGDRDGWFFAVRAPLLGDAGTLLAVTATFRPGSTDGTDGALDVPDRTAVEAVVPAQLLPTGQARVVAAPGSVLVAASAHLSGTDGYLDLVAVCPAGEGRAQVVPTATPPPISAPVVPRAAAPTPSGDRLAGALTQRAPHRGEPQPAAAPALRQLPLAGTDVASMLTIGVALTIAGVLLLVVRRRRPARVEADPDDDIRRPVLVRRA